MTLTLNRIPKIDLDIFCVALSLQDSQNGRLCTGCHCAFSTSFQAFDKNG